MSSDLSREYTSYYQRKNPQRVYPVEFVVRAYLGSYPRLPNPGRPAPGSRVLDLGFGDGRNMPLLADLGLQVFGVEISDEICRTATARMKRLGVDIDARVGRNAAIPFADAFFSDVLACHSCYYVDSGTRFGDNLAEIARVLGPAGRFVFSAPMASTYILRGAVDLGDGHMEITNDPYGVRNGCVLKQFSTESQIRGALAGLFEDVRIGTCRNDFWGIDEHVWTVVCRRC